MSVALKFRGPLFQESKRKQVIRTAVQNTLDYGIGLIKERTPVRTGRLQSGFEGRRKNASAEITNRVPYFKYVEDGTSRFEGRQMVARSRNEINQRLGQEVRRALDDLS